MRIKSMTKMQSFLARLGAAAPYDALLLVAMLLAPGHVLDRSERAVWIGCCGRV